MRFVRPGGWGLPRRPVVLSVWPRIALAASLLLVLATSARAATPTVRGVVVGSDGQPVARAVVTRVGGGRARSTVTTADGLFSLDAVDGCEVRVTLPGFAPSTAPCAGTPLRVVLQVAPLRESVVVAATLSPVPASQLGAATSTVTAAEITARQAPPVADLLRTLPGTAVVRSGAPGGITSLFVRGGESNGHAVYLDGIPLNEPGGAVNLGTLSSDGLARIELVRGAQSALFGSDALASVIRLVSANASPTDGGRPHVQAAAEAGAFGTTRVRGTIGAARDRWDYLVTGTRLHTDNAVPNSAFTDTLVGVNAGVRLSDRRSLRTVWRSQLGDSGTPGQTLYGRPDLDARFAQRQHVMGVTFEQRGSTGWHQQASYGLTVTRQHSTNRVIDPSFVPAYGDSRADFTWDDYPYDLVNRFTRHYAAYQLDRQWHASGRVGGVHTLTTRADWTGEDAMLDDRLAPDTLEAHRRNGGLALQHEALWSRVATVTSARVERNASFGTAVVPRGSAVLTLRQHQGTLGDTRLRASAGLGIKEPTTLQSFSRSPYYAGNPSLRPERSQSVDLGLEQRAAHDRLKVSATWFAATYRDIIGLRPSGIYTSTFDNIGRTVAHGLEGELEAAPMPTIHVSVTYTFTASEIRESTSAYSPVFAVGASAFRRPRHVGHVQVAWQRARWSAHLLGSAVGRYSDSDFASLSPAILSNPGHVGVDGRAAYQWTPHAALELAVDNLGNRQWQEPLGYPSLGRATRVGLRVGL